MKELRYHELSKLVERATTTTSSLYLERGDDGLTEDLVVGFKESFIRGHDWALITVDDGAGLSKALQHLPPDGRRWCIIVRDAHNAFPRKYRESLLMQLEHQEFNARLRVILVGAEPLPEVHEWFLGRSAYGVVNEPSFEKLGTWMAAKTAGRWDYSRGAGVWPDQNLITPETGLMLVEHVGWSYTAALQAAKTIRAYTQGSSVGNSLQLDWPVVSALVPARDGSGYADALVFGKGRKGAYTLSQGIVGAEVPKVLGLVRFYLRQFAKLRALEVERMSDKAVAEESGIHIWHWRQRYKPVYPSYTNERIRRRLAAVEEAIQAVRTGAKIGVLEVLIAEW